MLKIHLFIKYYILFLAMAKFKQACFARGLSKKFQNFTTVHNSFLGSAAKKLLSNLGPNLRAYYALCAILSVEF